MCIFYDIFKTLRTIRANTFDYQKSFFLLTAISTWRECLSLYGGPFESSWITFGQESVKLKGMSSVTFLNLKCNQIY